MTTQIYDRRGQLTPIVTEADLRRRIGRFWKLVDRRGTVGISQDGETVAVALSLDQFVSILFGIHRGPGHKRKRKRPRSKR